MKIGVVLPQTEIGNDPAAIKAYAEAVEDMGFTHILVFDHVLGANPERPGGWKGPYTYRHGFHEPFVLFGFLAAATRRVELVTGIVILPQRQTALVAKQAAAVDVLSGGRLRLGVGVGWNAVEFEALNENFENRGRRSAEQIAVLRALWTQSVVDFRGEFHRISHAGLNPMPTQRPSYPRSCWSSMAKSTRVAHAALARCRRRRSSRASSRPRSNRTSCSWRYEFLHGRRVPVGRFKSSAGAAVTSRSSVLRRRCASTATAASARRGWRSRALTKCQYARARPSRCSPARSRRMIFGKARRRRQPRRSSPPATSTDRPRIAGSSPQCSPNEHSEKPTTEQGMHDDHARYSGDRQRKGA